MERVGRWKTPRRKKKGSKPTAFARTAKFGAQFDRQMQAYLTGTTGAAGPCKRLDPVTMRVIEVIHPKGET
jgi:hypothetical protein